MWLNFKSLNQSCLLFRIPTMKRIFWILLFVLGSLSCTDDQFLFVQEVATEVVDISLDDPTHLRIVNELEEDFYSINAVEMGDFKFKNLNIPQGKSIKFRLNSELPVNIDGLEIAVTFSSETRTIVETGVIDLYPGGTTIIWLTGREGCGGCGGHSIEWGWED